MFRTKNVIPATILGAVAALSIAAAPANAATGKQHQRSAATKVHKQVPGKAAHHAKAAAAKTR
ncbi:hypothetical protein [Flavisphingomonas formosensis]|uniref:hypothetical protein n=1 Tax=Flavisphingomonas formosensis TaxID=861534 RepID=UPI0012F83F3F|nr:hypothetical protein [Sphingomonas formosensis]